MLESISGYQSLISRVEVKALNSSVCGMVGKQGVLNNAFGLSAGDLKLK
jgi:hypothetical protein